MTNFASTSGPRPIPEIRIESTSMTLKFFNGPTPIFNGPHKSSVIRDLLQYKNHGRMIRRSQQRAANVKKDAQKWPFIILIQF